MCVWIYRGRVQPEPRDATKQRVQSLKETQTATASTQQLTQDIPAADATQAEKAAAPEQQP